MIKFTLPDKLTFFDFDKIKDDAEIKKGVYYDKPKSLLMLPKTNIIGTIMQVPVMTEGNISTIQGKAKSRKTFFLILLSKLLSNIKLTIIDTEQYQYHSALMLHRIGNINPQNNITFFNLRKYSIDVRLEFIENYIVHNRPEMMFIDNIRDCMQDINSWVETNKILTILTQLTDEYKTHIVLTLHENPAKESDKARGAIGTELQNKSETVIKLEKNKETDYTKVEGLFCRNIEFDSFEFLINSDGLPEIITDQFASNSEVNIF